jgi:HSP20 family protein
MTCNTNCGCTTAAETTTQTATQPTHTYRPEIDIRETAEEFLVIADVPGATPESIDLTVDQGVLTLRAGVQPRDPTGSRRVVREYGVGSYERSFRIGEGVDAEKIAAELKDGVLTLRLPKSETTRARKIKVAG